MRNLKGALDALREYRWSSYLDYAGTKNFPSVIHRNILSDILGSPKTQERAIADIIRNSDLAAASAQLEYPIKLGHWVS